MLSILHIAANVAAKHFCSPTRSGLGFGLWRQCDEAQLCAFCVNVWLSDAYRMVLLTETVLLYLLLFQGRLPVKWMAPEALFDRVYTHQSDV